MEIFLEEQHIQINIEVERVTFQNKDNGWSVIKGRDSSSESTLTFVGTFLRELCPGENLLLFGKWTDHPRFGKQFKCFRAVERQPTQEPAIIRYLSSGLYKGIGERTATRIVKLFGRETLTILNNSPEKIRTVPSIGRKTATKIIDSWKEHHQSSEKMMFLSNLGISLPLAYKIIKQYAEETISIVSQNPYALIKQFKGIGFLTADKIAKSLGIPRDHPQRLQEAILFTLKKGEAFGHCFLKKDQILFELATLLEMDKGVLDSLFSTHINILNEKRKVVSVENDIHYLSDLYNAEVRISEKMKELLAKSHSSPILERQVLKWIESSNRELSEDQLRAVVQCLSHNVFVLTGGPGVGKTTTANTIISYFLAMGKKIALGAPTGRAAQRLTEVSSFQAKTIHRLLEWSPQTHGFSKHENNKLDAEVVIIDEASMLDVRLADSLLQAVPLTSQVIFIGDMDQLPPVGPGNFFRDLISSEVVPVVKLQKIFRQAAHSHIVKVAHQINRGEVATFEKSESFEKNADIDCRFIEVSSNEEIFNCIKKLMTVDLPRDGFDPVQDVQILTPMNKGDLGCVALNQAMQTLLNKNSLNHTPKKMGYTFFPDDKVIQTVNNYDLSVFNGDIGYVASTQVDGGKTVVNFSSKPVGYDVESLEHLNLAYAITIHKSQGSEFPVVIMPMTTQHYIMLQRNLVYTGLTRAKKLAIFIGFSKALQMAIKNQSSSLRQTSLISRLR